ncbi:hypothetical protein GmHk_14G041798 [Glycine max]|nr:hypothetical protein GmHk_14G041798 [Glycine max]
MTAKIQEFLPPLDNLIKEIIKLANNVLSPRSEHPKTHPNTLHSLPNTTLRLLQFPSQLLHSHPSPPKLVKQNPRPGGAAHLRGHPLP